MNQNDTNRRDSYENERLMLLDMFQNMAKAYSAGHEGEFRSQRDIRLDIVSGFEMLECFMTTIHPYIDSLQNLDLYFGAVIPGYEADIGQKIARLHEWDMTV